MPADRQRPVAGEPGAAGPSAWGPPYGGAGCHCMPTGGTAGAAPETQGGRRLGPARDLRMGMGGLVPTP